MAGLRDANGQIVINEQEAESDIRKINQAKAKLVEARRMLNPSKLDDGRMLGATRNALNEKLAKMNRDLDTWEQNCDSAARYIRSVVDKYRRIDREYTQKARNIGGR